MFLQLTLDYNNKKKTQIYNGKLNINPLFELKEKEINEQITFLNNFINNLYLLKPENDELCQKIDDYNYKNYYLCKIKYFRNIFNKFSMRFYKCLSKAINKLDIEEENDIKLFYEDNNGKYNQNIKTFKSFIKKPQKLYEFLNRLIYFENRGRNFF